MASRRDELNAYTFAKKRTRGGLPAALPDRYGGGGAASAARRPPRRGRRGADPGGLRRLGHVPAHRPPRAGTTPGDQGDRRQASRPPATSCCTDRRAEVQLHPVLNMASARAAARSPDSSTCSRSIETTWTAGRSRTAPTLGIPYAPDRLPERRGGGRASAGRSASSRAATARPCRRRRSSSPSATSTRTEGRAAPARRPSALRPGTRTHGARYLVDAGGTKYLVGDGSRRPNCCCPRAGRQPSSPSRSPRTGWRPSTTAPRSTSPRIPGTSAKRPASRASGRTGPGRHGAPGATTGSGAQQYVVLPGEVAPVSDFVALAAHRTPRRPAGYSSAASRTAVTPSPSPRERELLRREKNWPQQAAEQVNDAAAPGRRSTVCNVLRNVTPTGRHDAVSTWAGTDYPRRSPPAAPAPTSPPAPACSTARSGPGDQGRRDCLPGDRHRPAVRRADQQRQQRQGLRHRHGRPRRPASSAARQQPEPTRPDPARLQGQSSPCRSRRTGRSSCRRAPGWTPTAARQPQGS